MLLNLCERVGPFDTSKAIKITIITGDDGAMLKRMKGDQGIRGEITSRACFFQKVEKAAQSVFREMDDANMREAHPVLDDAAYLRW